MGAERCVRVFSLCLPNPQSCWPRSLTQLEVAMQDAPLVQVLESGKDLAQVVAHLGLQQSVPGLPDVGQGLRRATGSAPDPPSPTLPPSVLAEEEAALQLWVSRVPFPSPTLSHGSPFGCRAPGKCICCQHPQSGARNALCGGAAGRGAAQSRLGSAVGARGGHPSRAPSPLSPPHPWSAGPGPTFSR